MSNRVAVRRIESGVPRLDEMPGGALPSGYSLLVTSARMNASATVD